MMPLMLIDRLYSKSKKGDGTDVEVQCPKRLHETECETFHLHSNIAAEMSDYFAKIIIPHNGRVIQEVDAPTFEICVRYMYLEMVDKVTCDNVASVLAAADFLQMERLKKACFDFLEDNLDQANFETVKDIAEQFGNTALIQKADKFAALGSAQRELYDRKLKAEKTLKTMSAVARTSGNMQQSAKHNLESIECRLKHGVEQELRLNPSAFSIDDYLNDRDVNDHFSNVLKHSEYDITLGQVVIRKLQRLNPGATPSALARTNFPSGFEITMIWGSTQKFLGAIKNLNKKRSSAKRKYQFGREMLTFGELLDKFVDQFQFYGGHYDRSGLERRNIKKAVDALFSGFSTESVVLLKQWRLDYLVWRRQIQESTTLYLRGDHGAQARKAIREIFSHPGQGWLY